MYAWFNFGVQIRNFCRHLACKKCYSAQKKFLHAKCMHKTFVLHCKLFCAQIYKRKCMPKIFQCKKTIKNKIFCTIKFFHAAFKSSLMSLLWGDEFRVSREELLLKLRLIIAQLWIASLQAQIFIFVFFFLSIFIIFHSLKLNQTIVP